MVGHQYGMPHLIDSEKLFVFWIGACGFQWANSASDGELEYELLFLTNIKTKKMLAKFRKKFKSSLIYTKPENVAPTPLQLS